MNPTFDAHTHVWEHQWQDFIVGTGGRGNRSQCDLLLALMDRNGVERACVIGGCDETNHRNNDFVRRRALPGTAGPLRDVVGNFIDG